MRTLAPTLAILLAVGCGASAPNARTTPAGPLLAEAGFEDVDTNQDALLSSDEFMRATESYANAFDENRDGSFDEDELAWGLFRAFDSNGTGRVDEAELRRGAMAWWPEDVELRYRAWNTHPDGGLDEDELRAAVERTQLARRWDRDHDGAVTHAEVSNALFRSWDLDSNDSIDPFEWRWD